jgi:hypothetical protein
MADQDVVRVCTVCRDRGVDRTALWVATGPDEPFDVVKNGIRSVCLVAPLQWFECACHSETDNHLGVTRASRELLVDFLARIQTE